MMQPVTAEQTFLEQLHAHAIEYMNRGWSFFPVSISSKKPLDEWKHYQSRRPTREEVDEWFTLGAPTKGGERQKFFNLCIVTGSISGIVVLDCDNEEAVRYAMENRLASPFSVTTTRGKHFYFSHPQDGRRYANKVGGVARDWPDIHGLDFRGDGGYAILPPSVSFNADGTAKHQYAFDDCPFEWDAAPKWSGSKPTVMDIESGEFNFETLDLSETRVGTKESLYSVWEQAEEHIRTHGKLSMGGGRNQWLIKFAGEQVRKGVVGQDLVDTCNNFMEKFFVVPLERIEFDRTLESAERMDKLNYPDRKSVV